MHLEKLTKEDADIIYERLTFGQTSMSERGFIDETEGREYRIMLAHARHAQPSPDYMCQAKRVHA